MLEIATAIVLGFAAFVVAGLFLGMIIGLVEDVAAGLNLRSAQANDRWSESDEAAYSAGSSPILKR